ncbi:MAG: DUF2023 family protein, partial [Bacteroidales bacterium]|nr:DUF2023 family protein [Bacteroidales bacterium]
GIPYVLQPAGQQNLNVYFGRRECLEAIRLIVTRPLNQLTPEEDADRIAALVPYSGQVVTHYTERGDHGISPLIPIIDNLAPLYHMRPDCPPMLVISGDREMELYGRYEETAYFVRMMKLHGHKDITFYELDGFEHGDMVAPGHLVFLKWLRERERASAN